MKTIILLVLALFLNLYLRSQSCNITEKAIELLATSDSVNVFLKSEVEDVFSKKLLKKAINNNGRIIFNLSTVYLNSYTEHRRLLTQRDSLGDKYESFYNEYVKKLYMESFCIFYPYTKYKIGTFIGPQSPITLYAKKPVNNRIIFICDFDFKRDKTYHQYSVEPFMGLVWYFSMSFDNDYNLTDMSFYKRIYM